MAAGMPWPRFLHRSERQLAVGDFSRGEPARRIKPPRHLSPNDNQQYDIDGVAIRENAPCATS
jgi:hypothetical protein